MCFSSSFVSFEYFHTFFFCYLHFFLLRLFPFMWVNKTLNLIKRSSLIFTAKSLFTISWEFYSKMLRSKKEKSSNFLLKNNTFLNCSINIGVEQKSVAFCNSFCVHACFRFIHDLWKIHIQKGEISMHFSVRWFVCELWIVNAFPLKWRKIIHFRHEILVSFLQKGKKCHKICKRYAPSIEMVP